MSSGSLDKENRLAEDSTSPAEPISCRRGWFTAVGGALTSMSIIGNTQSFGVYQAYYARKSLAELSPSHISWIGSLQLFLVFSIGIVSGRLFDKGYFRVCMLSGGLIFILSSFMLSLVKEHSFYQNLLAQGIGMGVGMGLMLLPSISVVARHFQSHRSLALGLVSTGGGIGAVIYPIIMNFFVDNENLGFAWGTRLIGLLDMILLLVANILMKSQPLPLPSSRVACVGLILTDIPFWCAVLGIFFIWWGMFVPYFYLQLFSNMRGINSMFVAWVIPVMNAGSIVGRSLPNILADRYGPLNVMIPSTFISGALMWALLGVDSPAGMSIFAVSYGIFSGTVFTVVFPVVATFGTKEDLGLRIGISTLAMSFASLTGNPIAGVFLSPPNYIWWRPLAFACGCVMTGTSCLLVARRSMALRRGTIFV